MAVIPGKALLPFRLQGQCCIGVRQQSNSDTDLYTGTIQHEITSAYRTFKVMVRYGPDTTCTYLTVIRFCIMPESCPIQAVANEYNFILLIHTKYIKTESTVCVIVYKNGLRCRRRLSLYYYRHTFVRKST